MVKRRLFSKRIITFLDRKSITFIDYVPLGYHIITLIFYCK